MLGCRCDGNLQELSGKINLLLCSYKPGTAHLWRVPALKKIANFLPMAKPEANKFLKIILALMFTMSGVKFFPEAIEVCPTRTCRKWSECVRPGD